MNNKIHIIKWLAYLLAFGITAAISSIITINHRIVMVPQEIDLSKIVIGKTTVDQFCKIVGSSNKVHTCMDSCAYRLIKSESVLEGREIEIVGFYRGSNTGYHKPGFHESDDGESIITKYHMNILPKYSQNGSSSLRDVILKILDYEYYYFNPIDDMNN